MNIIEFQEQVERIKKTWGDRAFPDERAKMLWEAVKHHPNYWLAGVIDSFVANARQAPVLSDFTDAIYAEKERERKKTETVAPWDLEYKCDICYDMGVFLARNKNIPGTWAFRCHCEKGMNDPRRNIPHYKQGHLDEGFYFWDPRPTH